MSDFTPSASAAAEAGIPVTVADYGSDTATQVRQSLETMALKMREGRIDPSVYAWARRTLTDAGFDFRDGMSIRRAAGILLQALRDQTTYAPDAYGVEVVSSAAATLCLREDLCIKGGDCDDLAVALGSALLSLGIPVVIVKQEFGSEAQQHVLIAFQDEKGSWVYADPSTNAPLGSAPRAKKEIWVDPMTDIGDVPAPEAQIVTFGQAPPAPVASDWQIVTNNQLLDASRYRLGVLLNLLNWPQGAIDVLTPKLVKAIFADRYGILVEQAYATGDINGGLQSWIIQGIAQKNETLVDDTLVTFLAIAQEVPQAIVVPTGGTTTVTAPSTSASAGVSAGRVAVIAIGAAIVGGIVWQQFSKPRRRR